jgi:hypothetical protein
MLSRSPWSLVLGFLAGFLSVLVFRQAALGILHVLGLTSAIPYSEQATRPWGLALIWSSALWGGVWGIPLAFLGARIKALSPALFGTLFGAAAVTAGAWLVAMLLKGQALAAGWVPGHMLVGILVNGAWGFGTVLVGRFLARLPVVGGAH